MNIIKKDRSAEIILREVANILANEVKDHHLKYVTVTHVDLSKDFSYAKRYFLLLDKDKIPPTLEALTKATGFIKRKLGERTDFRKVPELKFIYDESIEYGMKIEKIINKLKED
jgi:ribosome-binding factor A